MKLALLLSVALLAFGIYNGLLVVWKVPTFSKKFDFGSLFKKKSDKYDDGYNEYIHKIADYIKPKLKKEFILNLQNQLDIAEINTNAYLFVANLIWTGIIYVVLAIIIGIVLPIGSIVVLFIGIKEIFDKYNVINKNIKEKKEKIEKEIPRFLDFMINSFKFNQNVKEAFISYNKIAGDYLKKNIEIAIADMETSNDEEALRRLDERVRSDDFSKVVRAIISVSRGDENIQYLKNLYTETASREYQNLLKEVDKRVGNIRRLSLYIFVCFIIMIFTLMGLQMIESLMQLRR